MGDIQGFETISTDDWQLSLVGSEHGVKVASPFDELPKGPIKLFATAFTRDLFVAAGEDGISVGKISELRIAAVDQEFELPKQIQNVPAKVRFLEFSADESALVICFEGGDFVVYSVDKFQQGDDNALICQIESKNVSDVQQRPLHGDEFAVLDSSDQLHSLNVSNKEYNKIGEGIRSVCWDREGSKLLLGTATEIVIATPDGKEESRIPKPNDEALEEHKPLLLRWVASTVILAVYANNDPENSDPHVYLRVDNSWKQLSDPIPAFGPERDPAFYAQALHNWHADLPNLIFLSASVSTDVALFTEQNLFELADNGRAVMPQNDSFEDLGPVGLALDVSSTFGLTNPVSEVEESKPQPILWVMTDGGDVVSWNVLWNKQLQQTQGQLSIDSMRQKYEHDVEAATKGSGKANESKAQEPVNETPKQAGLKEKELPKEEPVAQKEQSTAHEAKPEEKPSPFGGQQQSSPFGSLAQSSAFQQQASTPVKESDSPESEKAGSPFAGPKMGESSFGKKPQGTLNTFGHSPFGQSSFGQSSFGQSSFGQSSFGGNGFASLGQSSGNIFGSGSGSTEKSQQGESGFSGLVKQSSGGSIFDSNAAQDAQLSNLNTQGGIREVEQGETDEEDNKAVDSEASDDDDSDGEISSTPMRKDTQQKTPQKAAEISDTFSGGQNNSFASFGGLGSKPDANKSHNVFGQFGQAKNNNAQPAFGAGSGSIFGSNSANYNPFGGGSSIPSFGESQTAAKPEKEIEEESMVQATAKDKDKDATPALPDDNDDDDELDESPQVEEEPAPLPPDPTSALKGFKPMTSVPGTSSTGDTSQSQKEGLFPKEGLFGNDSPVNQSQPFTSSAFSNTNTLFGEKSKSGTEALLESKQKYDDLSKPQQAAAEAAASRAARADNAFGALQGDSDSESESDEDEGEYEQEEGQAGESKSEPVKSPTPSQPIAGADDDKSEEEEPTPSIQSGTSEAYEKSDDQYDASTAGDTTHGTAEPGFDENEHEEYYEESVLSDDLDQDVTQHEEDLVDEPYYEANLLPEEPEGVPELLPYIPLSSELPSDLQETVESDFDQFYLEVNAQFKVLHSNAKNLSRYTQWEAAENESTLYQLSDVYRLDDWKLSDVTNVTYLIDSLSKNVATIEEQNQSDDSKLNDLKRGLGSAALQVSRIQELIKYKNSEVNERALRLRSLPVHAVELQRKLRLQSTKLEQELGEVESTINVVKSQLSKYGSAQAPSVQGIRDSIDRITNMAIKRNNQVQQLMRDLHPQGTSTSMSMSRQSTDVSTPARSTSQALTHSKQQQQQTPSKSLLQPPQTPGTVYRDRVMDEIDFLSKRSESKFKTVVGDMLRNRRGEDILH